jgi:hypothetical protein
MRLKHVVLTNNNKVKDLVTLMDNKEQILSLNRMVVRKEEKAITNLHGNGNYKNVKS